MMARGRNSTQKKLKDPAEAVLIKYPRFLDILEQIQESYDSYDETAEPLCKAIVGPSGSGKSTIAGYFEETHPAKERNWGKEVPFLLVLVPSQLTQRSFAEAILTTLGGPYPSRGTLGALTRRIDKALGRGDGSHHVRLVALNEIQHFIDSRYGIPYETADWLKDRIEETGVPFIILGLEYGLELLDQNEQLKRMFTETIEIKPFGWEDEADRTNFRGILRSVRSELSDIYEFPEMEQVGMAGRLHHASFGLIGYLMKIIRGAAFFARKAGTKRVTVDMLARAYTVHVRGKDIRYPNPITDPQFDPRTAPQLVPPSEWAAERRMSWRNRTSSSRVPLRRDRRSLA